jgi:cytochrome c
MDLRVKLDAKSARDRTGLALAIAFALACLGAGPSHAAGDAAKGKDVFARLCSTCHTADEGGENKFGPNLFGVFGRKAGMAPGFAYSAGFKAKAAWVWTEDKLSDWVTFPGGMVAGTPMGLFQGVSPRDRPNIIAYLATLKHTEAAGQSSAGTAQ